MTYRQKKKKKNETLEFVNFRVGKNLLGQFLKIYCRLFDPYNGMMPLKC